ncbi:MAG: hypothetical protein JXB07_09380 [Anaerolineae bacterium]|nr:hypothetical protein [Anaerolineae bacterium]
MSDTKQPTFWPIALRAIVVHTITYAVVGMLASTLFDYSARFAEPPLSYFMRQLDDPIVIAGVLFQPLRGLLFGIVFYLLRGCLFQKQNGWLIAWIMLVLIGIFSTFGPTPGSIEGFVYTIIPPFTQLGGLIEVLTQSLLLAVLTVYWVRHSHLRQLNWGAAILMIVVLLLPILGLLASQITVP